MMAVTYTATSEYHLILAIQIAFVISVTVDAVVLLLSPAVMTKLPTT